MDGVLPTYAWGAHLCFCFQGSSFNWCWLEGRGHQHISWEKCKIWGVKFANRSSLHVLTEKPVLLFSCSVVSDSFVTPWTTAHQAPLSMEFSRQECWSRFPYLPPGDLPDPGIEPASPALASWFFTAEPPGKLIVTQNLWFCVWLFKCSKNFCGRVVLVSQNSNQIPPKNNEEESN